MSFASLSAGYTHYELSGATDAEVVVLVHGFSVPSFIWDPTYRMLTEAGFRVLRYDLFGRGYSDRPKTRYDIDLFVRQLADLLDALDIKEPINLCGLSMGGPITATFTTRFPEHVKNLILFDPAGTRAIQLSQTIKSGLLTGVGELFFSLFGNRMLLNSIATDFYEPKQLKAFLARYREQMQYRGFRRAILSTVREGMLGNFSSTYAGIGQQKKPVLLIWGRKDQTVPYKHSQRLLELIPQVEFHTIEKAGHLPHYERPEIVDPILLNFLSS